jgi:hypothetical protein
MLLEQQTDNEHLNLLHWINIKQFAQKSTVVSSGNYINWLVS